MNEIHVLKKIPKLIEDFQGQGQGNEKLEVSGQGFSRFNVEIP